MGITKATLPARSMRRKAFGAKGALVVSVSRISPRAGNPKPSSKPPPSALVAVRKSRRFMSNLRLGNASRLLDGGADAWIGAAAADIPGHRAVDVRIARLGSGGEQRALPHDLGRPGVTALPDLQLAPGPLHFLARPRGAAGFDG